MSSTAFNKVLTFVFRRSPVEFSVFAAAFSVTVATSGSVVGVGFGIETAAAACGEVNCGAAGV